MSLRCIVLLGMSMSSNSSASSCIESLEMKKNAKRNMVNFMKSTARLYNTDFGLAFSDFNLIFNDFES